MVDDVILNKCATLERCVNRIREEYANAGDRFDSDYTRQDAAILNIQRACEATLDIGQYLIRREKLGIPQSARDVFNLLADKEWITASLADSMKKMVGFRNIAVHNYQTLSLPIVKAIIQEHLNEFLEFKQQMMQKAS